MNKCVYGGQYGSEGKGSLAEYYAAKARRGALIVAGENSPNSGHTCSRGALRNLPAASFWASEVLLGPDAVIGWDSFHVDMAALRSYSSPPLFVHEHAAWLSAEDRVQEREAGIVEAISSTGSGTGWARVRKQFYRRELGTIGGRVKRDQLSTYFDYPVTLLNHTEYLAFIDRRMNWDWIFECSQGTLLDINFGRYPYCTSRSTLPRVAVERNGLGMLPWDYCGVFRTYPIRTGGPSGPTGGSEIQFSDLGVPEEIATVTKRVRRVFKFSVDDFKLSVRLNRPSTVAFTHLDYLKMMPEEIVDFAESWLNHGVNLVKWTAKQGVRNLMVSCRTGHFKSVSLNEID